MSSPTAPRPLMPSRIISPISSPLTKSSIPPLASKRRVASDNHTDMKARPIKKSKSTASTTVASPMSKVKSKFATKRPGQPIPFKVPALPRRLFADLTTSTHLTTPAKRVDGEHDRSRLATPTSSTIAASSSPRRSSPVHDTPSLPDVYITRGETIIFGRHRNTQSLTGSIDSLPPGVSNLDRSLPTRTINLPRSASHASRIHAAVQLISVEREERYRLVVVGQNGVKITCAGKTRRVKAGQSVELDKEALVDFYGCIVRVSLRMERDDAGVDMDDESKVQDRYTYPASPPTSLPPSSPPMMPSSPFGDDYSRGSPYPFDSAESPDSADSPLSEPAEPFSPIFSSLDLPPPTLEVKREALLSDSPLSPLLDTPTHTVPEPLSMPDSSVHGNAHPTLPAEPSSSPTSATVPLPEGVDLPALMANTVVFSGSSKLSLPDLVRHMLETQPSLKTHGDEAQWGVWANEAIEGNPMFGKVQRNGKDASGHPLLPHYYYSPDSDPDASRAKELGGLVRPLRAAQRGGGKALDWRPVGGGRRRY